MKPHWIPCVHEAAHAVIAHLQGGKIIELYVHQGGVWDGGCGAEFDRDNPEGMVLFLMAGFWSQHHLGKCYHPWDYCYIDKNLWTTVANEHQIGEERKQELWQQAESLVLEHRRLILQAAKRLQRRKPGSEVIKFITSRPYLETAQ